MNCQLSKITLTHRDGRVSKLEHVYLRGSQIRLFVLPDLLTNGPLFKKVQQIKANYDAAQASKPGAKGGASSTAPTTTMVLKSLSLQLLCLHQWTILPASSRGCDLCISVCVCLRMIVGLQFHMSKVVCCLLWLIMLCKRGHCGSSEPHSSILKHYCRPSEINLRQWHHGSNCFFLVLAP